MPEPTEISFSPADTVKTLAEKLARFVTMIRERVQFGEVRVGNTTHLEHNGDITCSDIDCVGLDCESFTMATGATLNNVLTADADGVGTWQVSSSVGAAGSDKEVQFNDGGTALGAEPGFEYNKATDMLSVEYLTVGEDALIEDFCTVQGQLQIAYVVDDGTIRRGQSVVDLDREWAAVTGACTKSLAEFHEIIPSGSNTGAGDGRAAVRGLVTTSASLAKPHHGVIGELAINSGAGISGTHFAVMGLVDSEVASSIDLGAVGAIIGADGQTASSTIDECGAVLAAMKGDSADERYGVRAVSENVGAGLAEGVCGIGGSTSGFSVGVRGAPVTPSTDGFGVVCQGNMHMYGGQLHIYDSTALQTLANKTYLTTSDVGSLYVESDVEIGGNLYVSGGVSAGAAGSDKEVQFNDGGTALGAEAGFEYDKTTDTLTVDNIACPNGTETDEVVNIDRTIDANVTKGAVTVTEARSGVVSADGYSGFDYTGTLDGTYFTTHSGHRATLTTTSGTSLNARGFQSMLDLNGGTLTTPSCYFAEIDSEISPTGPSLFGGVMALDGASAAAVIADRAGLAINVNANSATATYGAITKVTNAGSGAAFGYEGYGSNSNAATTMNAVGLHGYATSVNGVEVGLFAEPYTRDANGYAIAAKGHTVNYYGSTYILDVTADPTVALAYVSNKTHFTTTDFGCLYVQDVLEVDGILYADGGAVVTGDLTVTGDLKGARGYFDAAKNTNSLTSTTYLCLNNGMTMGATRGHVMPRAGSVISIGGTVQINSFTAGAVIQIAVRLNGGVIGAVSETLGAGHATGGFVFTTAHVARGTAPFVENDVLTFSLEITGTANLGYPTGNAEVVFDT